MYIDIVRTTFKAPLFEVPNMAGVWFYILSMFVLLGVATAFIMWRARTRNVKVISVVLCVVLLSFLFRVFTADFTSNNWPWFMRKWTSYYETHSIGDSLRSNVSNYVPLYNYFLIWFTRMDFVHAIYWIKILSTVFEMLLAVALVLIIAKLTNKKPSLILFAIIIWLPYYCFNTAVIAQCDAIYTFFGFLGFWFAINKKSFLACLFMGVSLAIKMQAILIMPILLVLLLAKYVKWRDIPWIAVPFFVLNCVPLFFGKSLWDTYGVYYEGQINNGDDVFSRCLNLPMLCNPIANGGGVVYNICLVAFIVLTAVALGYILYIAIKSNKQKPFDKNDWVFVTFIILITTMFLMPKMLFRFYFFASIIGLCWLCMNFNRRNLLCFIGLMIPMTATTFTFPLGNHFIFVIPSVIGWVWYASSWYYLCKYKFLSRYVIKGKNDKRHNNLDNPLVDADKVESDVHTESVNEKPARSKNRK